MNPNKIVKRLGLLLLMTGAILLSGCKSDSGGNGDEAGPWNPVVDPAQFVSGVTNPYFPIIPGRVLVYVGEADGVRDSIENRDTDNTRVVMGVTCRVTEFRAYENGELVEVAYDWYAQDQSGTVWYFGEAVENYENGQLVDTDGSWEAGVDGAIPGHMMKAAPQVGDEYYNEWYEEEAEDQSRVLSISAAATIGFGDFIECVQTADWTDLEPDVLEHKFYAPGVGLVRETKVQGGSGQVELVAIRDESGQSWNPIVNPANFVAGVNHPFFPIEPGRTLIYVGGEDSIEVTDTAATRVVMGVTCMIAIFREWEDGELVEVAYDWFAQDNQGNVWYFGEAVENYANGQYINDHGSWEAGVDGARPGYIMKADPFVGEGYYQEYYVGEAEDQARVLSRSASTSVPYGQFSNCIKNLEWTDLEPNVAEHKYFAQGIGLVREQTVRGGSGGVQLVAIRTE